MGAMMGRLKLPVAEKAAAKLARKEGVHAVGGTPGLYLHVAGGGRSWILRYSFAGRRRDLGLGSLVDLTVAEAREEARKQRKLIRQGIDPIAAKHEQLAARKADSARRMTFRQCVTGYLDSHGDGWKNGKHRQQWQNTLDTYAGAAIGNLDVAKVDTPHVLRILEPIWKTKTETATRLRGRIESVLSWATVRGYRHGLNPARWKGHLDQLLAKPSKVARVEHYAALPYAEVGSFVEKLRRHEGIGAAALEFAILTAARSGEVRGATWAEVDMHARTWTIPAGRMKAAKQHQVPLSDAAIAVLAKMGKTRLNDFIFPGAKDDKPLSDMSLTAVLRRMGRRDLTVHGFRSTFRDWAAEQTNFSRDVAEMALAHAVGDKVEAAYRRGDLFEKRRRLMSAWARYCAQLQKKAEVMPLRKKG
jgi:integrase